MHVFLVVTNNLISLTTFGSAGLYHLIHESGDASTNQIARNVIITSKFLLNIYKQCILSLQYHVTTPQTLLS